jgi:threonine dehydratase
MPITLDDVLAAKRRIAPYLQPTPLRRYAPLEVAVGGARVFVKHENHQPTNAFKIRNGLSAMTALGAAERARGVVAASRGNHGLGLAYAGQVLSVPVTVCVPVGNNPEKNEAMRGYGATVIEEGGDYDDAVAVADRLTAERGLTLIHSTNHLGVLAGAGTLALEILEECSDLDALVLALGGGSQTVGAITVARARYPGTRIYAVQAAGAAAVHDSWHAGRIIEGATADTFADGVATRSVSPLIFETLRSGLAGFETVTDAEIAEALRLLLRTTHNLVEGAGAAGLAGVLKLRREFAGQQVGIVLTGGNIDAQTLKAIVCEE